MKSFREAYKREVERIPVPVITMEQIVDEKRRKRIITYRKHRRMMAVASASCVFLLCTAGAVATARQDRSVIEADEYGFRTADAETAQLNRGIAEADEERSLVMADAGDYADGAVWAYSREASEEKEQQSAAMAGGADTAAAEEAVEEAEEPEEAAEREYFSYGAFTEKEQMPFAMPELSLLGEIASEHYTILGDTFLLGRVESDKGLFMVNQTYYGNTLGHASDIAYPEGVCNEREYVTSQGFIWLVVDSEKEEEDILRIHAAISAGDYELIVNFDGYTEEEAYSILEAMDLTRYF